MQKLLLGSNLALLVFVNYYYVVLTANCLDVARGLWVQLVHCTHIHYSLERLKGGAFSSLFFASLQAIKHQELQSLDPRKIAGRKICLLDDGTLHVSNYTNYFLGRCFASSLFGWATDGSACLLRQQLARISYSKRLVLCHQNNELIPQDTR